MSHHELRTTQTSALLFHGVPALALYAMVWIDTVERYWLAAKPQQTA
jgi:hypothetical protein